MNLGKLFIITAPSGAGKTTLVHALVSQDKNLCVSVSHTTRPARVGEENGINYHFIEKSEFTTRLSEGDFLESAEVYGYHYGTSKLWVSEQLNKGLDVILEIDWQGAQQIRKLYPDTCSIFILPPSIEALTERLTERAQDDSETIDNRMQQAQGVMEHVAEANFVVVNDDFQSALQDIRAIIRSQRLVVTSQQSSLSDLLSSLVKG
ncbi:MAG: guanylate kinase [Gammaproteobacteria bacterium]|jgi:guanylate kinase|nr:guanylate kinase [Gammaproteobacteria bacterium]